MTKFQSLRRRASGCVFARKGGYFAAITADGHRTPAAAASTRIVVKEQAAVRISAKPKASAGTLGDNFRPGSSHRGEQPIQASFTRHEFNFPEAIVADKLIVPFGDAKDLVHGLDPFPRYALLSERRRENFTQGGTQPPGLQEKSFGGFGVGLRQAQKLRAALRGDNVRGIQKVDETLPG
jgi:hypothetical protein